MIKQSDSVFDQSDVTRASLGVDNVDNTSDINKPISTLQQTALDTKTNNGHTHAKSEVGLANVDNTADADKPVSTAQATAIGLKQDSATAINTSNIGSQSVSAATKWNGSSQFTSTAAASGGVDGDIWFQY